MLQIAIPGADDLILAHLVCDMNGTLAVDGLVSEPVRERIRLVAAQLQVHLVTADTFGTLPQLIESFRRDGVSIQAQRITTGEEKAAYVRSLGPEQVVALGNGVNDERMFQIARLSIAVYGMEGLARGTLQSAAIVAPSPEAALDLLLHPRRLAAILRP